MNAIQYALSYVQRHIPKEVLDLGLYNRDDVTNNYTSIDSKIMHHVINPILKVDLNLTGGVMTRILVNQCRITQVPGVYQYLIDVPKHLTNDKSILKVLNIVSVGHYMNSTTLFNNFSGSNLVQMSSQMLNAVDTAPIVSTSRLEIIGENIILVQEPSAYLLGCLLTVEVENNENLENIKPNNFQYIGNLALLATKMYIWTNQVVALDMGKAYGGHDIPTITNIIEDYKDAQEQYYEELQKWASISLLNDSSRKQKYIKYLLGGNW